VQAARNLVTVFVELTAGVKCGEDNFGSRPVFNRMLVDWNSASIISNADTSVFVDFDFDEPAVSSERLVDRVVYDFIDEVM
jgi:hypothetical protein